MILEMNAEPSPDWAKEFQGYLEKTFNLPKLDAMCTVGEMFSLMRRSKEPVYKNDILKTLHILDINDCLVMDGSTISDYVKLVEDNWNLKREKKKEEEDV